MNRKLFGKNIFRTFALLALLTAGVSACTLNKIAGNPEKVLKDYIEAVQRGDFNAIYAMSQVTARQKRLIAKAETGDKKVLEAEQFQRHKAIYDAAVLSFSNEQWGEKFYFPPSAKVEIGKAHDPLPVEKEKMGDAYEKGGVVVVKVSVTYQKPEEAPEYNGHKLNYADYNCMLRKVRYEDSVMIYSYDDKWYFGGCLINSSSVK